MSVAYVEESAAELSLQEQLQKLSPQDGNEVYLTALRHFTTAKNNPTWWWEYFREDIPSSSQCWRDGKAFERIAMVIPDLDVKVWFIPRRP